jgi:hypothetical protein
MSDIPRHVANIAVLAIVFVGTVIWVFTATAGVLIRWVIGR